jgi:parallel beta-helix repeat protein
MRNSFLIVLFTLGVFPLMSTLAFGLPGLVNYKGLLTDPLDNPVAGPVNVTFTLWDAVTGGSQLGAGFSDTDSVTPNADGIYDTLIGDDGGPMIPDTVFKNDSVWLNVNVGGEDLAPRTRLTPVGAALHAGSAGDADTVDGLEGADLEESADITTNANAIAAETNRAQTAEATSSSDLTAEAATARAAEQANANAIAAEANRAQTAEQQLATAISANEVTNIIYVDAHVSTTGDGTITNPFLTIQEALAVQDPSGSKDLVIYLNPGTYTAGISNSDIWTGKLSFVGVSRDEVIVTAGDLLTDCFYLRNKAGGVTFMNMTIQTANYGIYTKDCANTRLINMRFNQCGSDGTVENHDGTKDQAGQSEAFASSSISWGGACRIRECNDVEIINCVAEYCLRGLRIQDCTRGLIMGNRIYRVLDNGIYLASGTYTGSGGCQYINIKNNVVEEAGSTGIMVIGGHDNSVEGNTIIKSWNAGIQGHSAANLTVKRNRLIGCNWKGFTGHGAAGDAHGQIVIDGNSDIDATKEFIAQIAFNVSSECGRGAIPVGSDNININIRSGSYPAGFYFVSDFNLTDADLGLLNANGHTRNTLKTSDDLFSGDADTVDGLEGADLEESADIAANAVAIAAEENRAQAAELTNATDIAAEATTARAAETTNAAAIAAIDTSGITTNANNIATLNASAFIKGSASAYVVVETTDNAVTNGTKLIAAYAAAKALTPHGQALGADNRAVVLVPPGKYDLGAGQLLMDTEYVDVAGLSTLRDNQYIYGTANGAGTGVLRQTADNVKIENLFVELGLTAFVLNGDDQDPAAYFPTTALGNAVVRNCLFKGDETSGWSMRLAIEYAGYYEDCTGGSSSFGYGGTASGTFTSCTGGNVSFGTGGTASGTFTNCTGGSYSFGYGGTASGTFTNCTGGRSSFGRSGDARGTFTSCTGGIYSFGWNGTASGTFTSCTGGDHSFGYFGTASGGKFYFCSGGTNSFSGAGNPTVIHCIKDGVSYP